VEFIRITYPHQYQTCGNSLRFSGRAGDEVAVSGFLSSPVVLDITNPNRPVQLTPQVISNNGKFDVRLQVPWNASNWQASVRHTLLAVTQDRFASPVGIYPHQPSHWHAPQIGADIAMISYEGFAGALLPLVDSHWREGKSSRVVPIGELYDEFTFGEHDPAAIRQFLQFAQHNWRKPPTYLLLNGRASYDPRNYLGLGQLDLVPTAIVASASLMTASDDWFSDFTNSRMPTIATGRLPVGNLDEAKTVVSKIVGYESQPPSGTWTTQALMVSDKDDTESFSQDTETVQAQLPANVQATEVFAGTLGTATARQDVIDGINGGQLIVNYIGHGSEEQWSGSDIFDTKLVSALTNGAQLPVFLIMDCLNGFFQDIYSQPMGVVLLLAPNGGAVATLASSGLNQPGPQVTLDKLIVQSVTNVPGTRLGDSILNAKAQVTDPDVRKTYVLLGDPAMKLDVPPGSASTR
jgi:hypothetical protein